MFGEKEADKYLKRVGKGMSDYFKPKLGFKLAISKLCFKKVVEIPFLFIPEGKYFTK